MKENHYGTRRVAEVDQAPYKVIPWGALEYGQYAIVEQLDASEFMAVDAVIMTGGNIVKLREIADRLNTKYGTALATVVHKPHTIELTPEADAILDAVIEDRKAKAIQEIEKHPMYSLMRDIVAVSGSEKVNKAFENMMVDVRKTPVDKGALLSEIIEKGIGGILHKDMDKGGMN